MDVVLVVRGKTGAKKIRLGSEATVVGRRRDCALCIPSAEVSRRHCILRCQDGYVTVEDLHSVNGTFLNDAKIADKEVVYPGDRLRVGPVKFVVQYQLSQSARAMLQATSPAEKAFDFGGDVEVVPEGKASSDFEIIDEIAEADLVEEDVQDAELVDIIENPVAVEIVDEPGGVEIIDDPEAVEVVEEPPTSPTGEPKAGEPDIVEIIDDPELVEGSQVEIINDPEIVEGSQVGEPGKKAESINVVAKKRNSPS